MMTMTPNDAQVNTSDPVDIHDAKPNKPLDPSDDDDDDEEEEFVEPDDDNDEEDGDEEF